MKRIFIAEDNAVNRELLRELLEIHGHTVIEAINGEEALRMVEESNPDILLLDLGMPVLDGYVRSAKPRGCPDCPCWPSPPMQCKVTKREY
jgi:CheY-like chemotaxis protein